MSRRRSGFVGPVRWPAEALESDRLASADDFRRERLEEPLEAYLDAFEEIRDTIETLLESTVDLLEIEGQALEILTDPALLDSFRYLAGPPMSLDDLKTLVDTNSIAPARLRNDPDLVQRIVTTILAVLDRRRFPWIPERREATEAERAAAVIASASLIATQRVATHRRTESKAMQEERVRRKLKEYGLNEVDVAGRRIDTLAAAPRPGEFCRETLLGNRKADLIVGLWDGRTMPIECKVSNSYTNSIKRLNNDAAVKAEVWRRDFGEIPVVSVAVLSGAYKLHNLEDAQERGLTIYWANRLDDLTRWIESTRAT